MHRQRFLFPALLLLTAWRLVLLPTCDLSPIEAMGAVGPGWTEAGPLVKALARTGMVLFGGNEFAVRFFAPLLALAASLAVWRLAQSLFDLPTAAWAVVIVNLMPAFNLAAITLTPGSVSLACLAGLGLCVHSALQRPQTFHPAWLGASAFMTAAVLADHRNLLALAAVVLALGWPAEWRHHLRRPGFGLVVLGWLTGLVAWLVYGSSLPEGGGWQPDWRVWPNVLRWLLLCSPLLLAMLLWAVKSSVRQVQAAGIQPRLAFLLSFSLPLLVADFGWGGWRMWPDVGFASWMLFAAILLAHFVQQAAEFAITRKIGLRTATLALAALQTLLLLRTDKVREFGLHWPLAERVDLRRTWSRFFSADPAGAWFGWRETAGIVRQMIAAAASHGREVELIANQPSTAAVLSFYLGRDVLARASGGADEALFITDDARLKTVPAEIAAAFPHCSIATIAEVRHAGQLVRTIKIFACHSERPSDG